MIGSYLDAGSTGRSAGFAPRAACMASLHRHCPRHVRLWTMDCYVPLPWPDSYRYHHCEKTSNTPICLIGKRCGYARTFLPGDAASSPSVATVSPTPRPFRCRRKAIGVSDWARVLWRTPRASSPVKGLLRPILSVPELARPPRPGGPGPRLPPADRDRSDVSETRRETRQLLAMVGETRRCEGDLAVC